MKKKSLILCLFIIQLLISGSVSFAVENDQIVDPFRSQGVISSLESQIENLNERRLRLIQNEHSSSVLLEIEDDIYFLRKRVLAEKMFAIAKEIYSKALTRNPFPKYVGIYDSLATASRIAPELLTRESREIFLQWYNQVQNELISLSQGLVFENTDNLQNSTEKLESPIDEMKQKLQDLLCKAQSENLEDIDGIEPNSSLQNILLRCELLQEQLTSIIDDSSNIGDFDDIINATERIMRTIKNRQILKYNLWAEKNIRLVDITKTYDSERASYLYKILGLIDLSLIYEPSLAREINQRMYYLYEQLNSMKLKTQTRYDSIFLLEKRKQLNDF